MADKRTIKVNVIHRTGFMPQLALAILWLFPSQRLAKTRFIRHLLFRMEVKHEPISPNESAE